MGRTSEKSWGGTGFIGVPSLRAKEWKAKFSTAEWTGAGSGGQSLHYRHDWGLKFPEHSQSGFGVGGRRGQARLGWGSPGSDWAWARQSQELGGTWGAPRAYLVPFDELTPAPQGLYHGGRLQLQRVDAGPGAGHGPARGESGTPGAPTRTDGAAAPSARSRAARSGPAASAPARPPVCPGQTRESAGPGRGGAGAGPQRHRPLPPASGPPAPGRRLPLAAGAATAARGGMAQGHNLDPGPSPGLLVRTCLGSEGRA